MNYVIIPDDPGLKTVITDNMDNIENISDNAEVFETEENFQNRKDELLSDTST